VSKLDDFIGQAAADCVNGAPNPFAGLGPEHAYTLDTPRLDIADDGPAEHEPARFSGDQRHHDLRAVQLRGPDFSPAMVRKAGRLYVERSWAARIPHPGLWDIRGDSGEVYEVHVWGDRVWFATCTCPARPSRWNRRGACAHRALGGWLRHLQTGLPIPRWPDLTLKGWTE
jgi:hypothetical protein